MSKLAKKPLWVRKSNLIDPPSIPPLATYYYQKLGPARKFEGDLDPVFLFFAVLL